MESNGMNSESEAIAVDLAPKTPPKRIQLKPIIAYSRRRFSEKKFTHLLTFHAADKLSDLDSSPPIARLTPGDDQISGQKKKEDVNEIRISPETPVESKKRKNDDVGSDKRPTKTPKKKIHRPKVVGESKPRRPKKPKTPEPKTPKRTYTKRNIKSDTRRRLDFEDNNDKDVAEKLVNPGLDLSIVVTDFARDLTLDLVSLVDTKGKRSKRCAPRKGVSDNSQIKGQGSESLIQASDAKADVDTLNENLVFSNSNLLEYSKETAKICNTVKPSLIDLNLPYVENETNLVQQSSGQHDNGEVVTQAIVAVEQGQISVVKKSKRELMIEHYNEEIKAWKLEVKRIGCGNADGEEAKEKLESERATFRGRIRKFNSHMNFILGDRRFSKWKGSVIDSVVGVFLTQNVSDILSSSAFIDLRAKFPIKSKNPCDNNLVDLELPDIEDVVLNRGQEDSVCSISCSVIEHNTEEKLIMDNEDKRSSSNSTVQCPSETKEGKTGIKEKKNKGVEKDSNVEKTDWEEVRKRYQKDEKINDDHKDSIDWEAVRRAPVDEIADTIKKRGQHNNIAKRIKEFLDRVIELHKTLDLEWLRDTPADLVQKYLLEFNGLGLKSVECIRLLAIQNVAFPVDTNVGRIAVRLGWVPLEPLPEELQIHLLQQYPIMDSIQKYLWPRLCTLDQLELYELHYNLITFGKVLCTKRNPMCNECPMQKECKHYDSRYASARKALPSSAPQGEQQSSSPVEVVIHPLSLPPPLPEIDGYVDPSMRFETKTCEPIIEMPPSPEPDHEKLVERDIEECCTFEDDLETIPTIRLSNPQSSSCAMVALPPKVAWYPAPKLKTISRLKTRHLVYKLPDTHCILTGLDKREDPKGPPYLLAIWRSDETTSSSQPSDNSCCSQGSGKILSDKETCCSCSGFKEQDQNTVRGTILIPCRVAMRGSFPLNGTYFQVNEVFADHESSHNPIDVPTDSLWNLDWTYTYFGTSTTAIFKGLPIGEIRINFWKGFMCTRAFDRKTGTTKPLATRLHMSVAQQAGNRKRKEKLE